MEEPQEQQKLNYGPVKAVAITIASFFGSQLFAGILIGLIPTIFLGWSGARTADWFESGLLPQTIIITLSGAITLLIIRWYINKRGNTFEQLGLNKPKVSALWQAGLALVAYLAAYLLLVIALKAVIPSLDINQEQDLGFSVDKTESIWLLIFSLVIVPPLVEEIAMRGFLFGGLRTKLSFAMATLITSILFALAHLPAGKEGLLWVGAIDTFVLSIALCYLREKTHSLWPPVLLHMMKNTLALIVLTNG